MSHNRSRFLARLAATGRRIADGIGGMLFLAIFLCFVVQVFARYLFNQPQSWTDELAVVLFVVLAFWSSAFMTSWKEHVTLDVLITALPPTPRRLLRGTGFLIMAALFLAAVPATADLTLYMSGKWTPVLDVNQIILCAPFLLMLVAFALRALFELVAGFRHSS